MGFTCKRSAGGGLAGGSGPKRPPPESPFTDRGGKLLEQYDVKKFGYLSTERRGQRANMRAPRPNTQMWREPEPGRVGGGGRLTSAPANYGC